MKKLLLLLIFAAFLHVAVQAQNKWDLRRCVEYAVSNNISVQQNDVQARLAALIYKQNKLYQIPSLGFSGSISYKYLHTIL
jgi:outer membrane protein